MEDRPGIRQTTGRGGGFTALTPVFPRPTDPSQATPGVVGLNNPEPMRQTTTVGWVQTQGGKSVSGRMAGDITLPTATIVVGNAAVGGGKDVLFLGPYELRQNNDWVVTVGDNTATAAALATAINRLAEFTATNQDAVITVTYHRGTADVVDFRVESRGVTVHLTPAPLTGTFPVGNPSISPPAST